MMLLLLLRSRTLLVRTVSFLTMALAPALVTAQTPTPTPDLKLRFPGSLMIGDTPCGEMYLSVEPRAASERRFVWHIDNCAPLEELVSGNPVATPTPRPTATPIGTPPGDPELCPDGYLTESASKTDIWYGLTVDVPNGATKRFCAPIMAPLVNYHPRQITFSWYDVSDQDCGALNVHVDAVDLPLRPRGGTGHSASGNYVYYGQIGSRSMPEQTAPGIYVMTLVGGPSSCTRYRIAWKAD